MPPLLGINSLIQSNVVVFHSPPMAPLESDYRRSTIHFQDLPCKSWHHALESLMAGGKVRLLRTVEIIGSDYCVVGADFEHMLSGLRRASIDRKSIIGSIDGSPVADVTFKACFDLPILYEVLDKIRKTCGLMAFRLC
jgi:hypothetical protein